jgi:hypothetical protein
MEAWLDNLPVLHPLETMSDESLAQLGLSRAQVRAWVALCEQREQEVKEEQAFLDSMRDSD